MMQYRGILSRVIPIPDCIRLSDLAIWISKFTDRSPVRWTDWATQILKLCITGPLGRKTDGFITVTPHKLHGVSYHQQFDCLFNRWYRLITKEPSQPHIAVPLWRDLTGGFPSQRNSNTDSVCLMTSLYLRTEDQWCERVMISVQDILIACCI